MDRIQNAIDARSLPSFRALVKRKGWTESQLRCDVPPTKELLALMEDIGLERYERYLTKLFLAPFSGDRMSDYKGGLLRQAGAENLPAGPAPLLEDFMGLPVDNNPRVKVDLHLKLAAGEAKELLNALYHTLNLNETIDQARALALAGRLEDFFTFAEGSQ